MKNFYGFSNVGFFKFSLTLCLLAFAMNANAAPDSSIDEEERLLNELFNSDDMPSAPKVKKTQKPSVEKTVQASEDSNIPGIIAKDEVSVEEIMQPAKKQEAQQPQQKVKKVEQPSQPKEQPQQNVAVQPTTAPVPVKSEEGISTKSELVNKRLASDASRYKDEINTLKQNLIKANREVSSLRNKLMLAETEVERLNEICMGRRPKPVIAPVPQEKPHRPAQERHELMDMPIATVIVDKANLRAGPGANNSVIMTVAKGTRLAIETDSGDWFRVITPTGGRAWISRDTIQFGNDYRSSPSRTVKVQAASGIPDYDNVQGMNQEAFDKFNEDEKAAIELLRKQSRQ